MRTTYVLAVIVFTSALLVTGLPETASARHRSKGMKVDVKGGASLILPKGFVLKNRRSSTSYPTRNYRGACGRKECMVTIVEPEKEGKGCKRVMSEAYEGMHRAIREKKGIANESFLKYVSIRRRNLKGAVGVYSLVKVRTASEAKDGKPYRGLAQIMLCRKKAYFILMVGMVERSDPARASSFLEKLLRTLSF